MSKRKADGEAGEEDTAIEEGTDADSEEGTDADLDSMVNTCNLSGSTCEEDFCVEEDEERERDAALNTAISAPIKWRNPCPRCPKHHGVIQYPKGIKHPKGTIPPDDDDDDVDDDVFHDNLSDEDAVPH